ncbi:MAG: hypothetical protein IJD58_08590 [Lachnospiraceae bacterium]|nr:hypothetical protein [Lachnospiraceae bacterium]
MRKYIKIKLIQLIESSTNLDGMIVEAYNKAQNQVFIELLSKCQDIAIKVGETIEKTVGADGRTIHLLEEFCELVYKVSQAAGQDDLNNRLSQINKKREQIIESIDNDIETRYEIVFLPYMASMWDSLESVWKAASEDNRCDVYVVALPYYEKDAEGNLKTYRYEGDKYPDYVPIVDYRNYDIEARHPDIIYFHNPYDEYNSSTSVPPKYYACELRNYTDMLVYIPYFVSIGDYVEPHLCALPGTMYSHKVIVESEPVRKIYIDNLHKFEIEKNCKGLMGNIEEKIVALGSPKYDMLVNKKDSEYLLPEKWRKCIYRQDGSKKRIMLYNISLSTLLKYDNIMEKIKSTLRYAKNNEEIVLWWRPHPLYENVLATSKPWLLEEYREIVRLYIEEGYGIYDDTEDLDRALIVTDMYYGDESSLVGMYKKLGKPIMIQNVDIIE